MPLEKSKEARVAFGAWPALHGTRGQAPDPAKPSRNHQVDDDEQILVEGPDHALAEAAQADNAPAFSATDGRRHRSEQEGAGNPYPLERLPDDPGTKRVKVELDIRKLGHGDIIGLWAAGPAGSGRRITG